MKKSTNKKTLLLLIPLSVIIAISFFFCTSKKDAGGEKVKHDAFKLEEFIYEIADALTPECHASTIAEVNGLLIAAWFGGTKEKNKDVGIWVSLKEKNSWSKPVEVVNGVQEDGTRYPCWNPVLFQPTQGPLMLFYKVGPNPRNWWGLLITSDDAGKTWSAPKKLPDGILGPIKNKPVQLANGDLLCPASTEHDGWEVQIESASALGETWTTTGSVNDGKKIGAIQPTILTYPEGRLQILSRTKNGFISECWSEDNGKIWGEMTATQLLNPNSGIDAVSLNDGLQLLVYNPTGGDWGARVPLSIAISNDGKDWKRIFDLEPVTNPDTVDDEEYSYPSVIQTSDGKIHIVYTYNRKTVKHVVLDPVKL
ncbi:exo-alpha-sialidase [candidate division KSB1 bacterium]|nr:exo-alpha-sialidase [candidate division KSB1 bacterium]